MPLSKDEERQLVQRMQAGDSQARDELVIAHLGLVKSIARKLCNPESNPELFNDLVQEGTVALIEAIDRFDPDKDVCLGTFAYLGVKGAMLDYLDEEQRKGINIPRPLRDLARKVGRVHDKLMQELKQQPTVEEIAEAAGESPERVEEALKLIDLGIVSLEELMNPTEEGKEAWDPSSQKPSPDEEVIIRVGIDAALQKLTPERRRVIKLRFWADRSLREIGEIMGKTENAVKQLLHNAKQDLQKLLEEMVETQRGNSADNNNGGDNNV